MGIHNNETTPLVKEDKLYKEPGAKDEPYSVYTGAVETSSANGKVTYTQAIKPEKANDRDRVEFSFRGLRQNDAATIIQKSIVGETVAYISGNMDLLTGIIDVAHQNTLIQKGGSGMLANQAFLENAHGNTIEQQGNADSVDYAVILKNAQRNTIAQGVGGDTLEIQPSLTTCDNTADGGTSYYGKKAHEADIDTVQFKGNRDEYKFTFNADGSITAFHKPTNTTPITFKNYEEVSFDDVADGMKLGQLKKSQAEIDKEAKEASGAIKLEVNDKTHEGTPQGSKPKSGAVIKY